MKKSDKNSSNIENLRNLVEELTIRDERIMFEHDFYEKIITLVLDGIWILNENSITTYVNDKMCGLLGYSNSEMVGHSIFEFIEDDMKNIANENILRRKKGIEETHFFKFTKKNGNTINVQISTSPLFTAKKFKGSIAYIKEVSDKEISNFYKQIFFDVIIDGFAIVDFKGIYKDVNEQFSLMLGYDKNEIIGQHYTKFVNNKDLLSSKNTFKNLLNGEELINFENNLIHKEGHTIKVSWRVKPLMEHKLIFATIREI